jgi:TatD DNase family protein
MEADWEAVARLCAPYEAVEAGYGVHPWYVGQCSEAWESKLREYLHRGARVVGEIGLDKWVANRDEALQEKVFRRQLQIAYQTGLPVSVHCLHAWGWMLEVLASETLPGAMHFHAFNGSSEILRELLTHGAYVSFSGRLFAESANRLREVFKEVPIARLLMETDAPDLAGPKEVCMYVQYKADGKQRNHPANLVGAYRASAGLRGMDEKEFEEMIAENFDRFAQCAG